VSLLLCDDDAIRTLNRAYRGQDRPTDVLSFSQEEGPPMPSDGEDGAVPRVLGDVAISIETARRQAREAGWTLQEEVEALLAHGLLHLLGYDHESTDDSRVMRAREDELLGEKSLWARAALGPPGAGEASR